MNYEKLVDFYNNYPGFSSMGKLWKNYRNHWIQDVGNYERFLKKGSILILGCGIGGPVWGWQQKGWDAHGLEISSWAVKNAVTSNIYQGDLKKMDFFKDKQFDNVLAFDILEHIPIDILSISLGECVRITNKTFLARIPYELGQPKWAYTLKEVFMEHMINQGKEWWEEKLLEFFNLEKWNFFMHEIKDTNWTLFKFNRKKENAQIE